MSDDIPHGLQSAFVLIACRHCATTLTVARFLLEQNGYLRTELRELERAGQEGDARSSRGASRAKAANRVQSRVCAGLVDVFENIIAKISLDPIGIDVLRALVQGKGYGSNEGHAGHGGRYACSVSNCSYPKEITAHLERNPQTSRFDMCASHNPRSLDTDTSASES